MLFRSPVAPTFPLVSNSITLHLDLSPLFTPVAPIFPLVSNSITLHLGLYLILVSFGNLSSISCVWIAIYEGKRLYQIWALFIFNKIFIQLVIDYLAILMRY